MNMNPEDSRYYRAVQAKANKNRRAKLTGTAIAGAMLVLPLSCGNSDEAAFATAETTATTEGDQTTSTIDQTTSTTALVIESTSTIESTTTLESTTTALTETTAATTATTTSVGGVFPTGAEMLVSFTYQPSETDRAKRPYVAVWVEDGEGNLVKTVSLWYQQDQKGQKWIDDLSHWFQTTDGDDTTMSGATRSPGDYTVAWDGTDSEGNPVEVGDYVLNIESAREHGPTSYTTGTVSVSDAGFTTTLADDGELSGIGAVLAA